MPIDVDVQAGYKGTPEEKSTFDRMVATFMAKIKQFYDNFKGLQAQRAFVADHPQLAGEYNDLMKRATSIDAYIRRAKSLITAAQGAWSWFLRTIGLGGVGELEALPAVAIAVAAGGAAIALITKWLTDAFIFSRKISAIQALEAKGGITATEAARRISETGGPALLQVLQKNIVWLVIGGSLLMFGPEILKWVKRMR